MTPRYGMYQQQTVQMRVTPQFRQAIRILQLPTPELHECIREELQNNPMLDASEADWDEYAEYYRQFGHPAQIGGVTTYPENPQYDPLDFAVSREASMEKHLKEQLNEMTDVPYHLRRIVVYMIGNLDDNGYLVLSPVEIEAALRIERSHVDHALSVLQSFEPAGIGAKDLQECLLIQAKRLPACPPLVPVLIRHHLEDIAYHPIGQLAAKLRAGQKEVQEAIDTLKKLNPRPGAAFAEGNIPYVAPDVRIEQAGERFVIYIQETAAPRLFIHARYERLLREGGVHGDAKAFLFRKLQAARYFIKCIEQRRATLLRVTEAIVKEQTDFFRYGKSGLKPMTLKRIADSVGLHESTVSRVTSGKYAQTLWGVFDLKDFFPSGYRCGLDDSAATADAVKARIKEWINGENRNKPYSDRQLADLLKEEGIPISRRTVAKYREELGITSSVNRKRL